MANAILRTAQSLNPGEIVSLFELDTRKIGGPVLYFVQGNELTGTIHFGGTEYVPIDCEFEGLETTGQGALPTPTIRLSNTDGIAQTAINTFGDLVDCQVKRVRTFAKHLDGHEDADENAFFGPDVFRIERKTSENNVYVEWELSASIDQEGKQMPGRHVVRDICLAPYRRFVGYSAGVNGTITQDKAMDDGVILPDGTIRLTSGRPIIDGYVNPATGDLIDVNKNKIINGAITLDDGTVIEVGSKPDINKYVTFANGTFINIDQYPIEQRFIKLDDGRIIDVKTNPIVHQFDYSFREDGMCPYTGDKYFDEQDKPVTDPAKDKPSRTIDCCKKRFGKNKPLYFWGFPGVARAR